MLEILRDIHIQLEVKSRTVQKKIQRSDDSVNDTDVYEDFRLCK